MMHWLWENIPILVVWLLAGYQLYSILQKRREGKVALQEWADTTGLTPLQVQVAFDAAVTAFHQRVEEMQKK